MRESVHCRALQFVGLGLVYNLDKKTLATIEADLEARKQANA